MALIVTPHVYRDLLLVAIVVNIFMVVTSTVVGGYMVETAQAISGSGRLTAIRQFVQQGCLIVNGPVAGYLASIAFGWTAGACGGIMFLLVPVTVLFLREQRQRLDSPAASGQRPRAACEHRDGSDDVGGGGADGAVLHRAGLRDGGVLQAAERAAHGHRRRRVSCS